MLAQTLRQQDVLSHLKVDIGPLSYTQNTKYGRWFDKTNKARRPNHSHKIRRFGSLAA